MLRSKIRKLTAQLSLTKSYWYSEGEQVVINDVWESIRNNDDKAIAIYESFGKDTHHRVRNINEFKRASLLGFEGFKFGEYGWMEQNVFNNREEISLKHIKDKASYNRICLGQAPNGFWGFSYNYYCGGAGGSGPLTVFNNFYATKKECTTEAFIFLKKRFEYAVLQNDTANYKMPYCQQLLDMVEIKLNSVLDFAVNKKGQIMLF